MSLPMQVIGGIFILGVAVLVPEMLFQWTHHENYAGLMPEACLEQHGPQFASLSYKDFGFNVDTKFILHSPRDCRAPGFPVVALEAGAPINAWIQIIETDFNSPRLSWFVDSMRPDTPFYTLSKGLSDTPSWGGIGFYFRRFTYFRARAYPVEVGANGVLHLYPAVAWGFEVLRLSTSLESKPPVAMADRDSMQRDRDKLATLFPQYSFDLNL